MVFNNYVDGLFSSSPRTFYQGLGWLILLSTVMQPLIDTMLEEMLDPIEVSQLWNCQSPQQMVETLKYGTGSNIRVLGQ